MSQDRKLSGCQVFHAAGLPIDWACVPLGDRVELAYGKALTEEDRKPGGVDVYGSNGRVGSHNAALVNGAGILIGRKGTVGAVHFAPRPFWPIDTVYYLVQKAGDNLRFLHHLLDYLPLANLNAATGVPGLSRRDAYALRGVFPPSDDQHAIATILDAVDTTLERNRAAVNRALDVKKAVLQRFFYEALGETAYANHPRRNLPAGWSLVSTGDLLSESPKNGVSPEASSQPPGTPTFSIAAIRDGRIDLSTKENLKFVRIQQAVAQRFAIEHGDVLIVRGNANPEFVGQAGMVTTYPAGCIYPDITMRVVFRTGLMPKVIPEFGVLAWNHPVVHNQVLRRAKTSNGTLKINSRDVKQIVMPVPPETEQARLIQIISAIDAQINALTAVATAQYRLKSALMHDLLTGRIRVGRLMAGSAS
jgi:type I restriction enzyme, S subunit